MLPGAPTAAQHHHQQVHDLRERRLIGDERRQALLRA
jgi:hypothetical protein